MIIQRMFSKTKEEEKTTPAEIIGSGMIAGGLGMAASSIKDLRPKNRIKARRKTIEEARESIGEQLKKDLRKYGNKILENPGEYKPGAMDSLLDFYNTEKKLTGKRAHEIGQGIDKKMTKMNKRGLALGTAATITGTGILAYGNRKKKNKKKEEDK